MGANNVTIDLHGHTVLSGPEVDVPRGSVEVFNKRKVTVKNGIIRGSSFGLSVIGRQHNKFSNLVVSAVFDGGADACKNRWCNNRFTTDSEGDGPKQGCIR